MFENIAVERFKIREGLTQLNQSGYRSCFRHVLFFYNHQVFSCWFVVIR